MVVTERPSTCTAKSEHDFTAAPSSRTVQAPHWLVSQPTCVPVSPSSSRRKYTSKSRGSTSRVYVAPLTRTLTGNLSAISPPSMDANGRPTLAAPGDRRIPTICLPPGSVNQCGRVQVLVGVVQRRDEQPARRLDAHPAQLPRRREQRGT